MKNEKGFTLVELLIVSVILSIVLASLTLSFQIGLKAHERNERYLADERTKEIFIMQLSRELRNSIPLSIEPFEGNSEKIRFPSRLRRYSKNGFDEGLYEVKYEWRKGALTRMEKPLKRESLKQSRRGIKETVFEGLTDFRFEYLFVSPTGQITWQKDWESTTGAGLPRAVRVEVRGGIFGDRGMTREIVIPQGVLRAAAS